MDQFKNKRNVLKMVLLAFLALAPLWHIPAVAQNAKTVQGKNENVTLQLQQVTLDQFFSQMKKQTGYNFIISSDLAKSLPKVNVQVRNKPVREVLNNVLGMLNCTYDIEGRTITVYRKAVGNRTRKVSGYVRDENGEILVGVPVCIGDSRVCTITDENGYYTFDIPTSGCDLKFTFVGMKTLYQPIAAGISPAMQDVVMRSDTQLDEVVVTGIFTKAKESYTGAVSTITSDQIELYKGQNLLQTLKNIDASLHFTVDNINGSNPNNLPNISVRGSSSLPTSVEEYNESNKNNPNTPLVILDGFEISLTDLMDYNDEEIQSINILKDAAATAIYGSRGANGVIVVQTKKPEAGHLKMNLEVGTDIEVADISSYHLLNAADKLELECLAGLYDIRNATSSVANSDIPYKEAYNKRYRQILSGLNVDWLSKPLHTGIGQNYKLRLEGGSDEFRWSTALNFKDVEGAMRGSNRKTFSGAINLLYKVKNLTFQNKATYSISRARESKYGSFSTYVQQQPYNSPYDENGNLRRYFDPFTSNFDPDQNPLYDALLNSFDKNGYDKIQDQFSIEWKMTKDLLMRAQLGISSTRSTTDYFLPAEHSYFTVDNLSEYSTDEGILRRGLYRNSTTTSTDINANVTFAYNHVWAEKHSLYAGLDWSVITNRTDGVSIAVEGFSNDDIVNIGNARQYAQNQMPSGTNYKTHQFGVTGNINYTFDNRYYLDLSYRMDGSSAYGADKKYAPFWSTGIGWNLHREKFLEKYRAISMLRLKASYGETGAATSASTTDAYTTYNYITDNRYMVWTGAQLAGLGNPNLTWQKTKEYNVGMEFSLWENRIKGTFDVYSKRTNNLLSAMYIPYSMGVGSYMANVGEVKNTGWEASISGYVIRDHKRDMNLMLTGQLIYNKNRITKLSEAIKQQNEAYMKQAEANDGSLLDIQSLFYEGYPQSAIYAVRSQGIDPASGQEIFLDRNGNVTDTWNAADKVYCGQTEPKYNGIGSALFQWKGWQLNVALRYYWGGQVYNSTLRDRVEVTTNTIRHQNVDERVLNNRWYQEGDVVFFKALSYETSRATSRYVMDDNVLELSSIALQYKWKNKWLMQKLRCNTVIFGVTMNDIAHWGTVRMERGTSYPYARNTQASIKLLF